MFLNFIVSPCFGSRICSSVSVLFLIYSISYVKVRIRVNQSAYAAKLLVFLEHFYSDLTWLMTAGIEQEFLTVVPSGGPALLEDTGKDIYSHTEIL